MTAPLVILVPRAQLRRTQRVPWHALTSCRNRGEAARLLASFRFKNDERRFARRLARAKTNLWLFRSNQTGFCGDFVVVDMSSPDPQRRRVFVIDLKQGAPLRVGGGGCGVQFRNASRAVADLARRSGVVPAEAPFLLLSGDGDEVHGYLCRAAGASAALRGAPWETSR